MKQRKYSKLLVAATVGALAVGSCYGCAASANDSTRPTPSNATPMAPVSTATVSYDHVEGDYLPIMVASWETVMPQVLTAEQLKDYNENYDLIKRTIICEAGNQGFEGMQAVAQVIYDRANDSVTDWGEGFYGILTKPGQFAKPYKGDISAFEPTVSEAMEAVFVRGEFAFDCPTFYFYNPKFSTTSGAAFMQTLKYVDTIKDHEFRTEWYSESSDSQDAQ